MFSHRTACLLAVLALVIAGCADRPSEPQPQGSTIDLEVQHPDLELLDPDDPANIQIIDLPHEGIDPVPHISAKDDEVRSSNRFLFRGVAQVPAPEVGGTQVQVTDLKLSRDGKLGIAVANYAGEASRGAVQILDLSNPSRPELTAEVLMKDTEYNSIALWGELAFMVGNDDESACLDLFNLGDPSDPRLVNRTRLEAHTALSLCIDPGGTALYVVTGAAGGLHEFDIFDPAAPRELNFTDIPDARQVELDGNTIMVLHGGGLMIMGDQVPRDFQVPGLPEVAPSRGTLFQGRFYVNTNDGVTVVDPEGGFSQKILDDPQGTANGMDTDNGNLFYRANGEGGLQVLQRHGWRGYWRMRPLGTLDVANAGSSNSVAAHRGMLLSGDGRGGVLITTINGRYLDDDDDD